MKIELKNVKHYSRMSEETNACSADVYVDGKKVGTLENSGKGEGMYPRGVDQALMKRMNEYVESRPPVQTKWGELKDSLDFYLARLVSEDLLIKGAAKLFAKKICIVDSKGVLFEMTVKPEVRESILRGAPIGLKEGQRILFSVEEVAEALRG